MKLIQCTYKSKLWHIMRNHSHLLPNALFKSILHIFDCFTIICNFWVSGQQYTVISWLRGEQSNYCPEVVEKIWETVALGLRQQFLRSSPLPMDNNLTVPCIVYCKMFAKIWHGLFCIGGGRYSFIPFALARERALHFRPCLKWHKTYFACGLAGFSKTKRWLPE